MKINESSLGIRLDNYDSFSSSLAANGSKIYVGAVGDDDGGSGAGAVYMLEDKNGDGFYTGSGELVKINETAMGIELDSSELFWFFFGG